ncbi:hypothetical protein L228DRAFT_246077 [Xylona heveae TC161]|uniref:Uncharacterized protein n=1 Tax=Xylona heveae (strain CBS 132557 / TC161) TaxID=1328760 RepID=A0A165HCX4_XYLHT|nr:hypothetical protein L228DRAFT_246077 [Xylona heveae TC161]KZF23320.1 hypothetical protein L228DRAFT_246077 [Xylona heveae TC161]
MHYFHSISSPFISTAYIFLSLIVIVIIISLVGLSSDERLALSLNRAIWLIQPYNNSISILTSEGAFEQACWV